MEKEKVKNVDPEANLETELNNKLSGWRKIQEKVFEVYKKQKPDNQNENPDAIKQNLKGTVFTEQSGQGQGAGGQNARRGNRRKKPNGKKT